MNTIPLEQIINRDALDQAIFISLPEPRIDCWVITPPVIPQ